MRKLFFILTLFSFSAILPNVCPTGGPEIYTEITDNEDMHYKITAVKWENAPIYGENLEFTTNFDTAEGEFDVEAGIHTVCEGFDWIKDWQALGNTYNDDLGYGFYKISIIRDYGGQNPQMVLSFYIDLRMDPASVIGTPDVMIKVIRNSNGTFNFQYSYYTSDGIQHFDTFHWFDTIRIWENNQQQQRDWSKFEKNVELTNDFDGATLQNQQIQLLTAQYGFPEEDENNYEGKVFNPGSHITLWQISICCCYKINYTVA